MCSASGTGSPVVFSAFRSKGCATRVLSRTKRRYPGGAYVTSVCADASVSRLLGVERADAIDAVLGLLAVGEVQEVVAVGEKLRPADAGLFARRIELHERHRRASGRGDALDRIVRPAVEEDHASGAPAFRRSPSARRRSSARAAGHLDLLELPLGDEAEEPAVGRPEGPRRPLRPRERLRRQRIQRRGPRSASCPAAVGRVEGDVMPVRRDARRVDRDDVLGRRDLEADGARSASARASRNRTRARRRREARRPRRPTRASPGSCAARRPARARPPASRPPRSTGAASARRAPCASGARAPWRDSP